MNLQKEEKEINDGSKGEIARHATSIVADPAGLGRWNYIDIVNSKKRLRIIFAHQCEQSKSSLGIVFSQRRTHFLARDINTCPRKLITMHLV